MWQNPLRSFCHNGSADYIRFLCAPLRGLRTTSRFAKSQERKQTSFSGLRKSAEPMWQFQNKTIAKKIKMKKISLFLAVFLTILFKAQTYEYEYSSSIKYNSSLRKYEQSNSYDKMKMIADINEANDNITLTYIGSDDTATLNLYIVEKTNVEDNSVLYICKGKKSNLIDKIVIRKNRNGETMTVMVKCQNESCPNGSFHFNK